MGEDFFEYLPSEIVINILSRLPTRAAMACKCVCKLWLVLLATPEFVNSNLSRSVPGIVVQTRSTRSYDVIEFVNELGLNFDEEHRWNTTFSFKLPFDGLMHSSANGLIFLRDCGSCGDLILCNPITRDYIKLPSPRKTTSKYHNDVETFGFGVSRMTGQYKVVRIFVETLGQIGGKNECQVYTVGTGSWRKVPYGSPLRLCEYIEGVHMNGNIHWMIENPTKKSLTTWISCFDLETELCSTFPAPPPPPLNLGVHFGRGLYVLRDCLCAFDISIDGCVIIWSMSEDDKCWTKELVIPKVDRPEDFYVHVWPIKVFENDDAVMETEDGTLFYYSNKTKNLDYFVVPREDHDSFIHTIIYASSFLSIKSFVMKNVSSF